MVPGYTGSKEDFADLLDPLAARGFRVVAIDQPGQYESPGPADRSAYGTVRLSAVVADVARTLADEDGRRPHLLGHSFGGLVTRAAVIDDPTLFASYTMLCSGPGGIGGSRKERMNAIEPILLDQGMAAAYDLLERLAAADPRRTGDPPALTAFLRKRWLASSVDGLLGMGDALLTEPDRTTELAAAELPILVCCGDADDAWPPEIQRDMAVRLGARFVVIPGAGHSPPSENPAETIKVLTDFWSTST